MNVLWNKISRFRLSTHHILRAALIIGAYLLVYDLLSTFAIYPFTDRIYAGTFINLDPIRFNACSGDLFSTFLPYEKQLKNYDLTTPYIAPQKGTFNHIRFSGRAMVAFKMIDRHPYLYLIYGIHQTLGQPDLYDPQRGIILQIIPPIASLATGILVFFLARWRIPPGLNQPDWLRQRRLSILAALIAALDVAILFNILNLGCG